ncbi:DUF4405 domain-containing protein [Maridesulfovibrio sp.]|uniref:DUF4405 domain-containing protein n=1 Tax=Maridesulfovibrio sp. TaxID=2795000 RepID=UPI0029F4D83F|nr:DUF4405 domain-containing protein [Maridesulfovibrio sp.]
MLDKMTDRSFLSPVVAFTFIPMTITGILMLFHVHFPGIKDIHEWIGLAFAIFSSFHIAINWKPFMGYLSKPLIRYALAIAVALIIVCCIIGATNYDHTRGYQNSRHSLVERY